MFRHALMHRSAFCIILHPLRSLQTEECLLPRNSHTWRRDSAQPPISRAHFIIIVPPPAESATNSHIVAAQTNNRNLHMVAGLGTELLVDTPESRASYAWDRNQDVYNHIISFANHQQTVQRSSRTRQLNVFIRCDSDYHRVLNRHGSESEAQHNSKNACPWMLLIVGVRACCTRVSTQVSQRRRAR